MSGLVGAGLGLLAGTGLWLAATGTPYARRSTLDSRLAPYLRDAPRPSRLLITEPALAPGELVDPVVAAAMAHYQFETLHPFNDGNGRIGWLLVVLHLLHGRVLSEPSLTISPWLEARRADYSDRLLAVSTRGDWDSWIRFFADGLTASASDAEQQLTDLLAVSRELKQTVRRSGLRAENAVLLVDYCLQQPIFTVRQVHGTWR